MKTPKDELLKSAVADAKAVKETAMANAMLALKETFRPSFEKMIVESLAEGDLDEQTKLDSSDIGSGAVTADSPGPKDPAKAVRDSSHIDNPGLETDTIGEDFGAAPPAEDESGLAPAGVAPSPEAGAEGGDAAGGDELDLEAIIRELEADLMQGGEDSSLGAAAQAPDVAAEVPAEKPAMETVANVNPAKVATGIPQRVAETLEGDGDEGVHKDGKNIPSVDGVPGGKKVGSIGENSNVDEEVDLDEIMREIGADATASTFATENAALKESLTEHREVIKLLRKRIQEVNLLNSKLMFTTKLFRNFTLAEAQKKKILDQFDRAATVREAKLVFTTLVESLRSVATPTQNNVTRNLAEGARSGGSTKTVQPQKVLTEGDVQADRFRRLAGITND